MAARVLYSKLSRDSHELIHRIRSNPWLFLVAFWLTIYPARLTQAFAFWDEPLYANVARQAAEHGHWLVPTVTYNTFTTGDIIGQQSFLLKPPLAFWLQALSMDFSGLLRSLPDSPPRLRPSSQA